MKIGWGWRILFLYVGFITLIGTLVFKSANQHFDLVSDDYYKEEVNYQKVLDAGKNQMQLSSPVLLEVNDTMVLFHFPSEFNTRSFTTNVQFYSAQNEGWDRKFELPVVNNILHIRRDQLQRTGYKVKISWETNDKKYYQESELNLHS